MMSGPSIARGENHIKRAALHRRAFTLRVQGMSYERIGQALVHLRTGRLAGNPYSPATVHGWCKAIFAKQQPKDAAIVEELRLIEDARLESYVQVLQTKIRVVNPCKTCGRGETGPNLNAIQRATELSKRKAHLWGLDAPKELAVIDASRQHLDAYTAIVKMVLLRDCPVEQAHALLHAIEVAICEAEGVASPADVEVASRQVLEVGAG